MIIAIPEKGYIYLSNKQDHKKVTLGEKNGNKADYEHDINELTQAWKDYVIKVKYIFKNSKVSGGKQTKDLQDAKAEFHYKNKQEADAFIKKYKKTLPTHVPEPGKGRGKGKKRVIKSPKDIAYDKRHKNIVKYIKNNISDKEFEPTDDETIDYIADDAISKGIKKMSILIIEQLKYQ